MNLETAINHARECLDDIADVLDGVDATEGGPGVMTYGEKLRIDASVDELRSLLREFT